MAQAKRAHRVQNDMGEEIDRAADAASGGQGVKSVAPQQRKFAAGAGAESDNVVHLVEEKRTGLFSWADVAPRTSMDPERRLVRSLRFADLGRNPVTEVIERVDAKLTPSRGLRELVNGRLAPLGTSSRGNAKGRTLLLVHGTFSRTESAFRGLLADETLMGCLRDRYARILSFDYPTLSSTAFASALELRMAMEQFPGPVDVVAHSQGGLVTRWWIEAFDRPRLADRSRQILVGGTLQGTSLASPIRIGAAVGYLTNLAHFASKVISGIVPSVDLLAALTDILGIAKQVGGTLAAVSAGVGVELVPGLAGMSRVGTNAPLEKLLRLHAEMPPGYRTLVADFRPSGKPWEFLRRIPLHASAFAVSKIFPSSNDLIVDCDAAVTTAADAALHGSRHVVLSKSAAIHHTNYFDAVSVRSQIADWLIANP